MRAVRVHTFGDADVLSYDEIPTSEPGPGQVRVKIEAIGVNFVDIYRRKGLYPGQLPFIVGSEAAGVVDAIGPGVTAPAVGDRVASAAFTGAYATYGIAPADVLVPIPANVDSTVAAAVLLQGMTAHYLAYSTYALSPRDTALVHAAAGGVGLLLVQLAKRCGARVIGTVSTEEKAQLAREAGADEVIIYMQTDFTRETRRLTDGRGVDVVYDSVGLTTFEGSLDSLRPRGYMVLYGQSSGPVPPFNLQTLNAKGSLYVTRPSLGPYTATRDELMQRANDLFMWIGAKELAVRIDTTFPLADAAQAHRYLEDRRSRGKVLLRP